jgi:hypothetical protein
MDEASEWRYVKTNRETGEEEEITEEEFEKSYKDKIEWMFGEKSQEWSKAEAKKAKKEKKETTLTEGYWNMWHYDDLVKVDMVVDRDTLAVLRESDFQQLGVYDPELDMVIDVPDMYGGDFTPSGWEKGRPQPKYVSPVVLPSPKKQRPAPADFSKEVSHTPRLQKKRRNTWDRVGVKSH